jgi:hypothetical protein
MQSGFVDTERGRREARRQEFNLSLVGLKDISFGMDYAFTAT